MLTAPIKGRPINSTIAQATCTACVLLINDLPVLDVPPASAAPTPQLTGCITLPESELQRITLLIAAANVSSALLGLDWAACDNSPVAGAGPRGPFNSMAEGVGSPDVWDQTLGLTGEVCRAAGRRL